MAVPAHARLWKSAEAGQLVVESWQDCTVLPQSPQFLWDIAFSNVIARALGYCARCLPMSYE
jgi:hypothetical protein